jgi:GNAT superfamily N-acetyltransferase
MFLSFHGDVIPTGAMLTRAASDAIGTKLYTNADEAFHDLFLAAGFADEMQSEAFELDFAAARAAVERAWIPSWCRIISAAEADRERLLTLDSQLRQDVPGCDGWCGDRNALDADLDEAPPFDPDGYLVASDNRSGEYVGLIRIWRNPSRPRIGMIGVLRSHRGTVLAAALLKRALAAAATWGSPTFTTEAALSNPVTYPRLIALGARRQGRFWQMVYG